MFFLAFTIYRLVRIAASATIRRRLLEAELTSRLSVKEVGLTIRSVF